MAPRGRSAAAAVSAGVLLFLPATAVGQADPTQGVHEDPGSPAGKEYQIPVATARSETLGAPPGSSSSNPPLFGSGITPGAANPGGSSTTGGSGTTFVRGSSSTSAALRRPGGSASSHPTSVAAAHGPSASASASRSGAAASQASGTPISADTSAPARRSLSSVNSQIGDNSWLPLAVGGVLVLMVAAAGGLALRRRALDEPALDTSQTRRRVARERGPRDRFRSR